MPKNPVSNEIYGLGRIEAILEGRVARATYCLDQLQYTRNPVERLSFIEIAKLELALLQRILTKL